MLKIKNKRILAIFGILTLLGGIVTYNYFKKNPLGSAQNIYAAYQTPTFTLDISSGKIASFAIVKEVFADEAQKINEWSDDNLKVSVTFDNGINDSTHTIDAGITRISTTKFKVVALTKNGGAPPGDYKLKVEITQDGKTREIIQDFAWGVLAVNPNKSIFLPGEKAQISMAVLDEKGSMACDAEATLTIVNPAGQKTVLTTKDEQIIVNKECHLKDFTTKPDYQTTYQTGPVGIYQMAFSAKTKNGFYQIADSFEVQENIDYEVERVTATRVYPPIQYPVTFNIKFNKDFNGTIEESVPDGFQIFPFEHNSYSNVDSVGIKEIGKKNGLRTFAWTLSAKKGETKMIGYQFLSTPISPYFYLLGPLTFKENGRIIFQEARAWQIANDTTGDVILLWDTANGAVPGGWTCISCSAGQAFYGVIPRGATSYDASTGGNDNEIPSVTYSSAAQGASGTALGATAGSAVVEDTHTHTWGSITTTQGNLLPPFKNLNFIYAASPSVIPANVIGIFDTTSLPLGWTQYAALDGNVLRGYSDNVATGSATHNHTIGSTGTSASQTMTDSGNKSGTGALAHGHTLSGNTSNANNNPPYVNVYFAYNSSGGNKAIPNGLIALFDATPPTNWSSVSGASPYNGNFLKGATSSLGSTGGSSATHDHGGSAVLPSGTGGLTAGNLGNTGALTAAGINHTHDVTFTVGSSDSLPRYRDTIIGKYTQPPITISGYVYGTDESTYIGNPPCDGSTAVVSLKVNGTGSSTAHCDTSTGYYEFTGVTAGQGDTITIYLTSTAKANFVDVVNSGFSDITTANLFKDRVIFRDDDNGSITNSEAGQWDADNDATNMLFTIDGSNNLTSVAASTELHIYTGDTYAPGGTVTIGTSTTGLHIDDSGVVTLANANSDIYTPTVDTGATFNINTSTYLRGTITTTGTITYSGTPTVTTRGATSITGAGTISFYNLTVGDATTSTTTASSVFTLGNDLAVGTSSTLNLNISLSAPGNITPTGALTYNSGSPTLTMTGSGKVLGGASGNVTLYNFATTGTGTRTFSAGGTNTINGGINVGTGTTLTFSASASVAGGITNTGNIGYSGTPTLTSNPASSAAIGGGSGSITFYNLSTSGTGTTTVSYATAIDHDLNVGSGTTLTGSGITITMTGGSITNSNVLTFGGLTISGTITTSSSFTINGALTVGASGNFVPSAGTITLATNGWSIVNSNTAASLDFYILSVSETPSSQSGASYTVSNSLAITTGKTFAPTGGTIVFDTGTTSISNSGTITFSSVTFNGTNTSNVSFTVASVLSVGATGNFSPSGGTITKSGGSISNSGTLVLVNVSISGVTTASSSFSVSGNWSNASTFTASAGTITLNGADSSTQAISGNSTFYNLSASTAANTAGRIIQYAGSSVNTISGTWTMNGANTKVLTLQSSDTNNWQITPTATSVDYVYLSRSTNNTGTICASHSTGDGTNSGYIFTLGPACGSPPNTPSLDSPANGAGNQSVTPALLTTATDPNSDYMRYKIELCENSGMTVNCQTFDQTSSQTGWSGQNTESSTAYTSGTQATYTIQSPFANSFPYYWRSYAIDPYGAATWSSTQGAPYSFSTIGSNNVVTKIKGGVKIFGNTIFK